MDPQSPPKRMTRARAAAKANSEPFSTASTVTATTTSRAKSATTSSKAKSARSTTTSTTSLASSTATATRTAATTKRKLRVEDVDTDNEHDELSLDDDSAALPAMHHPPAARTARGRPKKAAAEAEPEPPSKAAPAPPARAPRGRPSKKATAAASAEPAKDQQPTRPPSRSAMASSNPSSTAPAARGTRTKKATVAPADEDNVNMAAADEGTGVPTNKTRRTTRTRAASTSSKNTTAAATAPTIAVRTAATTVAAAKTTVPAIKKKKVSFEEPEKENIAPSTAAAAKGSKAGAAAKTAAETAVAGLRAKPTRRAAAAATGSSSASASTASKTAVAGAARTVRSTSGSKASDKQTAAAAVPTTAAAPLSPKKVTQVRLARGLDDNDDSEDELGASDAASAYIKPLMRSPVKPVMSVVASTNGANTNSNNTNNNNKNGIVLPPPDLSVSMLASPARHPPPSPVREGLVTSPAKRFESFAPSDSASAATPKPGANTTSSLLFTPAKRFPAYVKSQTHGGDGGLENTTRSPFKTSLLHQTPAKRPSCPAKAAILLQRPDIAQPNFALTAKAEAIAMSPEPKSTLLAVPESVAAVAATPMHDNAEDQRESLKQAPSDVVAADAAGAAETAEAAEFLLGSPTGRKFSGRLSAVLPRPADLAATDADALPSDAETGHNDETVFTSGDPMDIDDSIVGATAAVMATQSLPKKQTPSGIFALRAKDLVACDLESDSEDDLTLTSRLPRSCNDVPSTPCPAKADRDASTPGSRTGWASSTGRSTSKRNRSNKFGFTPLAEQLNSWKAHSPLKAATTPKDEGNSAGEEVEDGPAADVVASEPVQETQEVHTAQEAGNRAELSAAPDLSVMPTFFEEAMEGRSAASSPRESISEEPQQPVAEGRRASHAATDILLLENEVPPLPSSVFDDVPVTEEDLDLAEEANNMSLMEPEAVDGMMNLPLSSPEDSMSEASQEYGDENAVPIDPILLAQSAASSPAVPPVTPQRTLTHTFHTVSKIPLKPADDSTPPPAMRRRSMSVSRLPTAVHRRSSISSTSGGSADNNSNTCGLVRNATVISYSPTKKDGRRESRRRKSRQSSSFGGSTGAAQTSDSEGEEQRSHRSVASSGRASAPATPAKSEAAWSTTGTPARTPRRDLNTALLRGAVVFVDVHTTEGADASGIFVELLSQMGARCVKSWPWNPSSPPNARDTGGVAGTSSRAGITHVVFKDGSKRTLEKVREAGGVVQCVGVSWVLDCERANDWLDEAPYAVDTSLVPRGGARRRKSMEPQAIANLNGTIVSTPAKQTMTFSSARECRTAPSTPANRRESALWVRTPDDESDCCEGRGHGHDEEDANGEPDWNLSGMLTPLPKTPAPEAIARYAANLAPSTPLGSHVDYAADNDYDDDEHCGNNTLTSMDYEQRMLVTRTCPPKTRASYHELGDGILAREKDEGVLMRLMAARRKSLQFAPKIASPLSRAWN
ncbi:brct domain containing protein [Niveomyces insectorum RCEF 264]|uniref:Brct domain containing protein n=1 Tax=Niveomyces insectorum RCEF 264 TaxID=1081102 RepID=A0A167VI91_9HYPO|nr:brct domain containing protein [Niveomyces insectorum RCEF 264]